MYWADAPSTPSIQRACHRTRSLGHWQAPLSAGTDQTYPAIERAHLGKMAIDSDDEFFGDQSSDDGDENFNAERGSNHDGMRNDGSKSDPFGNVASHEYRSREASIRTLSYLDGYDETKEEKLQDGFSDGYRKSYSDAMRIGGQLGSLCAMAALDESTTLSLNPHHGGNADEKVTAKSAIEGPATLVRKFLTEEILIGSKEEDAQKKYDDALSKLVEQLNGTQS